MRLTGSKVVLNLVGQDNMKHVEPNDFIIHLRSFQGGIEWSRIRGKVSNAYTVFTPNTDVHAPYFRWVLKSHGFIQELQSTTDQLRDGQSIKFGQFAAIPLPLPPLEVQRRIADFLDDQTARIDHIITSRQQQIELAMLALDSKWSSSFQELASQSPNPRLRWVVESISDGPFGSALKSSDYTDSGVRVIRLGNVGINSFKDWDRAFVSQEYGFSLSQHSVRAGDVIMAGLGDDKWPLGRCAVVPSDLGEAINKADCYRVRVGPSVSPEYVAWAVSAPPSRSALALLARGATRSRLNTQVAGDLAVPLPPPSVQRRVVSEWKRLSAMAEETIAAAVHSHALLQELKRSLISAAVSGEFDVSSADGSRVVV